MCGSVCLWAKKNCYIMPYYAFHLKFCRSGSSNGVMGNNKTDSTSQVSGGSSSIIPRHDLGNGSLSNDRRDRFSGLDKERATAKGSNKYVYFHDISCPLTVTSNTYGNCSIYLMQNICQFPPM